MILDKVLGRRGQWHPNLLIRNCTSKNNSIGHPHMVDHQFGHGPLYNYSTCKIVGVVQAVCTGLCLEFSKSHDTLTERRCTTPLRNGHPRVRAVPAAQLIDAMDVRAGDGVGGGSGDDPRGFDDVGDDCAAGGVPARVPAQDLPRGKVPPADAEPVRLRLRHHLVGHGPHNLMAYFVAAHVSHRPWNAKLSIQCLEQQHSMALP
jgi:hypothetical protein